MKHTNNFLPYLYGAYGSNLSHDQMSYRCPNAVPSGTMELGGWGLRFRGVADIEKSQDESVSLGLWRITEKCLHALDIYEGFPRFYRREHVAISDGLPVMAYMMNNQGEVYPPSEHYLQSLIDGYKNFSIDKDCLVAAIENSYTQTRYQPKYKLRG